MSRHPPAGRRTPQEAGFPFRPFSRFRLFSYLFRFAGKGPHRKRNNNRRNDLNALNDLNAETDATGTQRKQSGWERRTRSRLSGRVRRSFGVRPLATRFCGSRPTFSPPATSERTGVANLGKPNLPTLTEMR